MDRIGKRVLGGIGGGLQLLATLLPLFARGSLVNEDLETLSMLAVSPWLGIAAVTMGLATLALSVSGNCRWLWAPAVGTLGCLGTALVWLKPVDYGTGLGVWVFLGVLAMVVTGASLRNPSASRRLDSPQP
jgi:hypothetical protein